MRISGDYILAQAKLYIYSDYLICMKLTDKSFREPVVAGKFYPESADKLKLKFKELFQGLEEPKRRIDLHILGAIVPHAGYTYSGKVAAKVYQKLREAYKPDTIIFLGPSHSMPGVSASVWLGSDWVTPMGRAEIDRELGEKLLDSFFDKKPEAHQDEHAIEVQLPFVHYIFPEDVPKILPIAVSVPLQLEVLKKLAEGILKAVRETRRKVAIIASSDFTHYGIAYDYLPFFGTNEEISRSIKNLDMGAIEHIKKLNAKEFVSYVNDFDASICGASSIALLILLMKSLGAKEVELLDYATSSKVTGDFKNSVSYAGIIFKGQPVL